MPSAGRLLRVLTSTHLIQRVELLTQDDRQVNRTKISTSRAQVLGDAGEDMVSDLGAVSRRAPCGVGGFTSTREALSHPVMPAARAAARNMTPAGADC